ncbi:MAG: hypothetical protein OXM01_11555 [Gemmatimonadota bacterium]|nr:hypothetical protein [Gemmatimonadota bacterium]
MAGLYGSHTYHEHIPQDDRLLGLLVIAEEETEFAGDVVEHLQKKRVTLLGLTADERLYRRADDMLQDKIGAVAEHGRGQQATHYSSRFQKGKLPLGISSKPNQLGEDFSFRN